MVDRVGRFGAGAAAAAGPDGARTARPQLERELREAIRSGRLRTGERLPSSRALAGELGVSCGLVLDFRSGVPDLCSST